jgi:hypothetical protein
MKTAEPMRTRRLTITNIARLANDFREAESAAPAARQFVECSLDLASNQQSTFFTNAPPTGTTHPVILTGAAVAINFLYRINAHRYRLTKCARMTAIQRIQI